MTQPGDKRPAPVNTPPSQPHDPTRRPQQATPHTHHDPGRPPGATWNMTWLRGTGHFLVTPVRTEGLTRGRTQSNSLAQVKRGRLRQGLSRAARIWVLAAQI